MTKEQKLSVFLVEDEVELANSLKSKLETEGFQVLTCENAVLASRMARNQKFNCIVVDERLPGGSGSDVIIEIRKNQKHINHTTPILIVSAYLDVNLLKKVQDKVSAALVKPFERDEFVQKIKSLCSK